MISVFAEDDDSGYFLWRGVFFDGEAAVYGRAEFNRIYSHTKFLCTASSDTPLSFLGPGIHIVDLYGRTAKAYCWDLACVGGMIVFASDTKAVAEAERRIVTYSKPKKPGRA